MVMHSIGKRHDSPADEGRAGTSPPHNEQSLDGHGETERRLGRARAIREVQSVVEE